MKWVPGRRSDNIEDRRGDSPDGGNVSFGGGGGRGFGGGKLGLGGVVILLILSLVFKQDFFSLVGAGRADAPAPGAPSQAAPVSDPKEEPMVQLVSFVLDDTQDFWRKLIPSMGVQYRDAHLVLFRDATETACGFGQAATGPFYCPGDAKVYIDLGFFEELKDRFKAPGDFAQAYVLAHELGHHVQNLLGTSDKVHRAQESGRGDANALSVKLELQADCYAGVWANSAAQRGHLEAGDTDEGLAAAASVGDDRLQRMATGRVNPESWTHGSSAQRREWFRRGFDSGRPEQCDTFR